MHRWHMVYGITVGLCLLALQWYRHLQQQQASAGLDPRQTQTVSPLALSTLNYFGSVNITFDSYSLHMLFPRKDAYIRVPGSS